jgi:hypothetical protein
VSGILIDLLISWGDLLGDLNKKQCNTESIVPKLRILENLREF